jgi:radical SAM-linked protein
VPDQPEQQAPPVQRVRLRYAKRGRLRFTSHRDFARAFERALVRARVPMAYSSGFNPHPRISYAGAAPTGAASEAEYLEIGLRERVDPARVGALIDSSLPAGLDVLDAVEAGPGSLADRMSASVWLLALPDVVPEAARQAAESFLATPEVSVERMTKKGVRTFDCRAAVVTAQVLADALDRPGCAILEVVLRHGSPSVRPDDVLAGLREVAGLETGAEVLAERRAQGPLDEETGAVGDPLAPDRDA